MKGNNSSCMMRKVILKAAVTYTVNNIYDGPEPTPSEEADTEDVEEVEDTGPPARSGALLGCGAFTRTSSSLNSPCARLPRPGPAEVVNSLVSHALTSK
mmetsp:Transcript_13808/g.18880  ORF Transcript_13808/g.18880 Transcript_13808/m.18880 type:complete len:99 (+) Transcript_13808:138-434(+)